VQLDDVKQGEWDAKYREGKAAGTDPCAIVTELLPLLPSGPALDVACGAGRHALLLGSRPQPVTAVDWSQAALSIVAKRARSLNISIHSEIATEVTAPTSSRGIWLVQADLEEVSLAANSFSLVLCVHYLQRTLFPQIVRALRPCGVLLFETFTSAQLEFAGGPRNPAYLLNPGELRTAFAGLEILFYRELRAGQGIASLVARKPDVAH
jgi:tellurite methyltransferase